MKKFLSILLALAVGFTFTFGSAMSAFAATTNEFNANVNAAEAQVLDINDTVYKNAVKSLADKKVDTLAISADAWKVAAKALNDDIIKDVKAKTDDIKGNPGTYQEYTVAQLVELYENGGYVYSVSLFLSDLEDDDYDYLDKAAVAQFSIAKAAELAKLDAVDTTVYSTDVKKITYKNYAGKEVTEETSYKAIADAYIADAKAAINAIVLETADKTIKAVEDKLSKVTKISGKFEEIKDENKVGTGVYKFKDSVANTIKLKTIEQENLESLTLDAQKAAKLSAINMAAANLYKQAVEAKLTKDQMTAFTANKNAYVEMATYLVDIAKTSADLQFGEPTSINDIAKHAALLDAYKDLEKYAAKYAAETKDGVLVRDAAKINKVLETAKLDIYKNCTTDNINNYKTQIKDNCYIDDAVDTFAKEAKKAAVEAAREAALKNYYTKEQADVNAVYDAIIAKLDAAATNAALDKVNTKADLKGIKTKADVARVITPAVEDELERIYSYAIAAYPGLYKDDEKAAEALMINLQQLGYDGQNAEQLLIDWYAEKGARTAKDVEALFGEVKTLIDGFKTPEQLAAQKKAVEDQIAALPANITAADKDAVLAARAAADAYAGDIANESSLILAEKALAEALYNDIVKTVKALPAADKATVADKEAFKAAQANIDEYNKLVGKDGDLESAYKKYTDPKVGNALNTIKAAEKKAIIDALNDLPLNITLDNKEAVEAVRAAYDAYVAEYTDYTKPYDARNEFTDAQKKALTDAEAALAALVKVTDKDVKAYLNTLKVTVKSAKTSKKNVKVTAKVTVKATGEAADFTKFTDAGYTFKYKFYRSTKTTVKYTVKKAKDTTTWTNTAGKKGTKYYYKVKVFAYDKDGNFVGQTYQSQCNYTSKVFGK